MRRAVQIGTCGLMFSLALAGCGGGSAPSAAIASNLNGNWLIAGVLPTLVATFSGTPVVTSVALGFSVTGNSVVAGGAYQAPCSNVEGSFSGSYGPTLTGATAPDGSFMVQSAAPVSLLVLPTLTIQGEAPVSPGQTWKGKYSFGGTAGGCDVSSTGSFTATPIAAVSGTYVGTGHLVGLSGSTPRLIRSR